MFSQLHSKDTLSCGFGDVYAATHEQGCGYEPAVGGVDADVSAILGAVDVERVALETELHAGGLVLAELGDAGAKAEDVQKACVGVNFAPAVIVVFVGAAEFGFRLVAGALDDAQYVFGREVGLGLQPQGDDSGGDGAGHRCAAHA